MTSNNKCENVTHFDYVHLREDFNNFTNQNQIFSVHGVIDKEYIQF